MDRLSKYLKLVDEMPGFLDPGKRCEQVVLDAKIIVAAEKSLDTQIGVLYEDKHIIFVVDLLYDDISKSYRTKGRIIHRHGGATMIIPVTERREFVLLEQFRHGTQHGQFSFPRSFEYDGTSGRTHAEKLACELLNAVFDPPKFLGELTTESDLVSMKVAVYQILLKDYHVYLGTGDGILNASIVTQHQLESAIRNFKIDDSITIAAFELWKAHRSMLHKVQPESTF